MYADTDAYRSILALSDAIRSRYPQPRTVGALRFADGMARLHSYYPGSRTNGERPSAALRRLDPFRC